MAKSRTYYRAFKTYRGLVSPDSGCRRLREAIAASGGKSTVEVVRMKFEIKEDWIAEIENALPHIEKAVRAERQFIRREGEVVPIEKAKRASRDSFQHLARHSNLLTREPEPNGDIIPDGLFIVEKESDYKVYENRFLYTLLSYMRDFIQIRLNKLLEVGNTYRARAEVNKKISTEGRKITYSLLLTEDSKLDSYMMTDDEEGKKLERIKNASFMVASLLSTDLMQIVSTAPPVKAPITRTNVLKSNVDFKAALALFEYLSAYEGDGFAVHEVRRMLDPLPPHAEDDFAECAALSLFLTYEHGNDLGDRLEKAYLEEEEKRREAEREQLARQVALLRSRVRESGGSPEEYMLALEKYNRRLEADSAALENVRAEAKALRDEKDELTRRVSEASDRAEKAEAASRDSAAETERVRAESARALAEQKQTIVTEYEGRLRALGEEKDAVIAEATDANRELSEAYGALTEEKRVLGARLNALRYEHGLMTDEDDFTSKERFDELEREYLAFYEFFEKHWKKSEDEDKKGRPSRQTHGRRGEEITGHETQRTKSEAGAPHDTDQRDIAPSGGGSYRHGVFRECDRRAAAPFGKRVYRHDTRRRVPCDHDIPHGKGHTQAQAVRRSACA